MENQLKFLNRSRNRRSLIAIAIMASMCRRAVQKDFLGSYEIDLHKLYSTEVKKNQKVYKNRNVV